MAVHMQSVRTGEIRVVDEQSDEYYDMIAMVYDPGSGVSRNVWEQQGHHSANRPPQKEETLGLVSNGPEKNPQRNLTAGEIEAGLTSLSQRDEELSAQRKAIRAGKAGPPMPSVRRTEPVSAPPQASEPAPEADMAPELPDADPLQESAPAAEAKPAPRRSRSAKAKAQTESEGGDAG